MVNKKLLLGKMVMNGHSQISLAKEIGVSKNTIGAKINGKRPFNTDEISNICNVLGITDVTEKVNIFFFKKSQ